MSLENDIRDLTAAIQTLTGAIRAHGDQTPAPVQEAPTAPPQAPAAPETGETYDRPATLPGVPLADVEAPRPASVPEPSSDGFDSRGFTWDERIHAGSKAKLASGAWKYKRGVDKTLIDRVEAEQVMSGNDSGEGETPSPAAPPAPPAHEQPETPSHDAVVPVATFDEVQLAAGAKVQQLGVDAGKVGMMLYTDFGVQRLSDLKPEQYGHVLDKLEQL